MKELQTVTSIYAGTGMDTIGQAPVPLDPLPLASAPCDTDGDTEEESEQSHKQTKRREKKIVYLRLTIS